MISSVISFAQCLFANPILIWPHSQGIMLDDTNSWMAYLLIVVGSYIVEYQVISRILGNKAKIGNIFALVNIPSFIITQISVIGLMMTFNVKNIQYLAELIPIVIEPIIYVAYFRKCTSASITAISVTMGNLAGFATGVAMICAFNYVYGFKL